MKSGNDICMHSFNRLVTIDGLEEFSFIAEIVDYLGSLGPVFVHAFPKHLFGIVTALLQRSAVEVADSILLWRLRVDVEDMLAGETGASACDST
jgi:hypothetical protein